MLACQQQQDSALNDTTMSNNNISASVTQTAIDALQSKLSLVSIGYTPVKRNAEIYSSNLSQMATNISSSIVNVKSGHKSPIRQAAFRRQSPLVNAGYAARVSVVTSFVDYFISLHHEQALSPKGINMVLLGGGMDVLGLWGISLVAQQPGYVNIYEIDCDEIVELKGTVLEQFDGFKTHSTNESCCVKLRGFYSGSSSIDDDTEPNYNLLAANLKDLKCVKKSLDESIVDRTLPTLIISELVLAYLNQEQIDDLLSFLSSFFPHPSLFTYETMGGESPFSKSYYHRFSRKINGDFSLLGPHPPAISQRLSQKCHFSNTITRTALRAAVGEGLTCPEIFDEHAALACHLRCYAVSQSVIVHHPSRLDEEEDVRCLFRMAYASFVGLYPAIGKMVESGLRSDLSEGVRGGYVAAGGDFWVATAPSSSSSCSSCRIVGCIGIRQCEEKEVISRVGAAYGEGRKTFEIRRWVVHDDFRGCGMGAVLLDTVVDYVRERGGGCLIATTPVVMVDANESYVRNGFGIWKEERAGDLIMRTYGRILSIDTDR